MTNSTPTPTHPPKKTGVRFLFTASKIEALWVQHGQPHWQNLKPREQGLLKIAGVVGVIAIIYYAIWSPLQQAVEQAELRVHGQQQLLSWVQENTARYEQLVGGAATNAGSVSGSLTQRLNQVARSNQIAITRTQPQGNDLVVVIEEANFDQLLRFIHQLQTQAGMTVVNLDVNEAGNQPGVVRVRRLQLAELSS